MKSSTTTLSKGQRVKDILNTLGIWTILLLLFLFLAVTTGDTFLRSTNLINLVRQICVNGVIAIGATFVVCGGEIDLASGKMAALAGCGSAMLIVDYGMNTWLAILIALLVGVVFGGISGVVVTLLKVPAFIATLGMMYVLDGLVLLMTRGTPITGLPDEYVAIGRGYAGPIPIPVIILLVLVLLSAFVFRYTQFGRNIVTVGENAVSSRLSGINVAAIKIAVFAVGGAMSAAAGVMLTGRLSSGQPTAADDLSLTGMAAVFVGGTSSTNTQGAALKTLAGALFIGMINNGMNLLEINAYWQKIVLGIIIILAIAMDVYRTEKAARQA